MFGRIRPLIAAFVVFASTATSDARNQSGDNWYFGQNGGVTFVNGAPEPLAGGQINQTEGCASISDPSGNLLFYTDGISVWNASHSVMPNGTGMLGNPSATQSAIIVPKPGDSDIYYIFTVPATGSSDGLNYSVVDMTLDSGNGDIVSMQKNINLMATCSEEVTAAAHANGTDFWVLARPYNSDAFHAFHVSASGVNATPVISNAGTATAMGGSIGYLKASPAGDKLGMAYYFANTAEIYDFDASTGQVSNAVNLGSLSSAYGIEFSQDGTLVYVSQSGGAVTQFDLTAGDIPGSAVSVCTVNSGWGMQLGPDGKIYVVRNGVAKLGVINNPNTQGTGCDCQEDGPDISGMGRLGLPSFIQSFFAASADFTTAENTPLNFVQADFATPYNDTTSETLVQVKFTSLPANGTLSISGSPVMVNDEAAVADLDNLVYTPDNYFFGDDPFGWDGNSGSSYNFSATFTVAVTPVAQQPAATLPTSATVGMQTTDGLVITPNANDGSEVTHFKITAITGGMLFKNDGMTQISDDDFITSAEAAAGLKFTPSGDTCGFTVAGATSSNDADVSADTRVVSFAATPDLPTVTTAMVTSIDMTTAESGGDVTDDGGGTITARGVCWSTSANPTTADAKTTNGTGTGSFISNLTGLMDNTTYHVRAYATNSGGTAYGGDETFSTLEDDGAPNLIVTVMAVDDMADVGDEITFEVDVENIGDADATSVELRFPLPENTEFVGAFLETGSSSDSQPLNAHVEGNEIVVEVGDVGAAIALSLRIVLKTLASGSVVLQASVSSAEVMTAVSAETDSTTVQDQYLRVVQTTGPACGAVGLVPLLMMFGVFAVRLRVRR